MLLLLLFLLFKCLRHKIICSSSLAVDSAPPVMSAQKSEKDITDRSKKENEKDRSDQSQQHRNDEANKIDATRISNLELENKLLKNEMHSLNEELASTLTKLKEQQQGEKIVTIFVVLFVNRM